HVVHLAVHGAGVAAAAVHLLENDRGFGQAKARSAVLFRNHRRQPAGFGQRSDEGLGKALFLVDLAPVFSGEVRTEGAHAFTDGVVFFVQVRVHDASSILIVVAYALGGRRFSHPPKLRCSVEFHFSLLRDTAGIACPQLGLARRHDAPAHFERLRRDQRAHTPVGKTPYAGFGYCPAEGTQVQGRDQRAVHHQARVALGLGDVGPVVMNAVAIEGDGRIAEQQRRSGLDPLAPVAFRHWITAGELWRGRLAVDDVLLLTDGQPAVLQVVMTQGYEQQRTRAADLFLDIENGGGASGFAAYLQRLVEFQTPARPHAIAIAGRRQETTPRRMTVFPKAGLGDRA